MIAPSCLCAQSCGLAEPCGNFRKVSINKLRQQRAACEFGFIEKVLQKSEVGIKAFDLEISERALRLSRRAGKGRATTVGDDFGQQRIITGAGLIASVGKAVNPDPEACGWCIVGDLPACRFEKTLFG